MKKHYLFLVFLCLLFPIISFSQQRTVIGTVSSSEDGATIPGVTVLIKGTSRGTTTNIDGKYSINLEPEDKALIFSYVGMSTREITIGDELVINVVLESTAEALDEVVVVGYGTESRKLISSSLSDFKPENIEEMPVRTVDAALQGRVTGVYVNQNSGTPGAGMSLKIRGSSSISAGNEPLYVIDGIPVIRGDYGQIGFSGQTIDAISDLNPSDIESISILKDAAATSIYGARASNGVVLITTKRGKVEKTRINFNAYWGFQNVYKKLDMLDASQWMEYRNELKTNEGAPPVYSQEEINNPQVDTDWLDQVFRTGFLSNYELSAMSGTDKTTFYISGSYMTEEGILIGTDYKRLNGRLNIDHNISSRVKIGASLGVSNSWNNRVEGDQTLNGPLPNAIAMPAIYPVYNADGTYNEEGPYANPVAIANEAVNLAENFRTIGNIYADFRIVEGLSFNTKWGIDYLNLSEHSYDPATTRQGSKYNGLGIEATARVTNFTTNNLLQYKKVFNRIHDFSALAGYSFEKFVDKNSVIEGTDFPNEDFQYIISAANIRFASASQYENRTNSFFGRVNYNLKNRYLLSLSLRYDGSSKFGENNKYGTFPALSAGWRLSEEPFFSGVDFMNELKIRASYGLTGNDGIPAFSSPGLFSGGANYNESPGITPVQIPNPNIKWETTAQFNIGTDMAFLESRIMFSFDYYNAKTKDLLFYRPISATSGYTSVIDNIGEMQNQGLEFALTTDNIRNDRFHWQSVLNISMNRNEVLKLYNDQPIDFIGRGNNYITEGEPLGIFWGYDAAGVDPSTGDMVFRDVNGDGVVTSDDRTKIGDPNPDFIGGFDNIFTYKGFTLRLFLQFSYGNDVYNGTFVYIESMKGEDNQLVSILDRWRNVGDQTYMPRATQTDPNNNNRHSSRFIEDGSYMRVKELMFGYEFNDRVLKKLKISSLKLYVSAYNMLTWTNYDGMDPEVNYAGADNLRLGTDFFTYPNPRKVVFGINIGI